MKDRLLIERLLWARSSLSYDGVYRPKADIASKHIMKPADLDPSEHMLVGGWIASGSSVVADEVSQRIEFLITKRLTQVSTTADGWTKLFRDPLDGRLWEHSYPHGHLHGGGPPMLCVLDWANAKERYSSVV